MASTIKIKNSSTSGAVPGTGDLVQGELAINVTDRSIYTENASGTVVKLNAPSIDDKNTGATKYLTIDTSGNLGLGVTPSAWDSGYKALQVGRSCALWSSTGGDFGIFSQNVNYASGAYKYIQSTYATRYEQYNGTHAWYNAASGTAGNAITFTQAMTLDASGNLMVGRTSTTYKLDIQGNAGVRVIDTDELRSLILTPPNSGGDAAFVESSSANGLVLRANNASGFIGFTTGGTTERARIDSSGKFQVTSVSTSAGLSVQNTTSGSSGYGGYINQTDSTFTGLVLGVVGSRTTTNASYLLCQMNNGNGSGLFKVLDSGNCQNTNNSYGSSSDIKLKENIVNATPKLAQLQQVRIVNYNLIGQEQKQLGVVAQELEQVFPGMVEEVTDRDAEGNDLGTTTKSVKYSVFVPMLIKAMQEQQAIIESLKARLDAANL